MLVYSGVVPEPHSGNDARQWASGWFPYESQYDVSKEQTGQLDEREQKSPMEIGGEAI